MSANTGGPASEKTLLDEFAGQAMLAITISALSENTRTGYSIENPRFLECLSIDAYAHADAMLAEKARREAVVQESSTTDHCEDSLEKVVKLKSANKELVEFVERLAAFPLEEFGWQSRNDSQALHGWNDYTLYVSDIKRARNLVAKHKGAA